MNCSAILPVCNFKMDMFLCSFPNGTTSKLVGFSSHCFSCAKSQAGKFNIFFFTALRKSPNLEDLYRAAMTLFLAVACFGWFFFCGFSAAPASHSGFFDRHLKVKPRLATSFRRLCFHSPVYALCFFQNSLFAYPFSSPDILIQHRSYCFNAKH